MNATYRAATESCERWYVTWFCLPLQICDLVLYGAYLVISVSDDMWLGSDWSNLHPGNSPHCEVPGSLEHLRVWRSFLFVACYTWALESLGVHLLLFGPWKSHPEQHEFHLRKRAWVVDARKIYFQVWICWRRIHLRIHIRIHIHIHLLHMRKPHRALGCTPYNLNPGNLSQSSTNFTCERVLESLMQRRNESKYGP